MLGIRSASWSTLALALALALACARPRTPAATEPVSESAPAHAAPVVWTERETLEDAPVEAPVDDGVARFQTAVIGVAHGPSRLTDARAIADAIIVLGLPIDDVWSVDVETWTEDGDGICVDRIAYYTDTGRALANALRGRLPASLDVAADKTSSNYDLIVQLCPPGIRRR